MIDHVIVNLYGNRHTIKLNNSLEELSTDLWEYDYFKYDYDVCEEHSENYIEICMIYTDYIRIYESNVSSKLVDISMNLNNIIKDYDSIEDFISIYDENNNKIDIYNTIYAGIPAVNIGKSLTLIEEEKFNVTMFKYHRENEIELTIKNKLCNTIKSIYIIDSDKKNCIYSDNIINSNVVDILECEYILDIMASNNCIYLNFSSYEYFSDCVSIELIDDSLFEIDKDILSILSCTVKKTKQYKLHSFNNFDLSMDIVETSGKIKYGLLFVKTDKK